MHPPEAFYPDIMNRERRRLLTKSADSTFLPPSLSAVGSGGRANQFRAGVAPADVQRLFTAHCFANHGPLYANSKKTAQSLTIAPDDSGKSKQDSKRHAYNSHHQRPDSRSLFSDQTLIPEFGGAGV